MMKFIQNWLSVFGWKQKPSFPVFYDEVYRNERCYCGSGKKYKRCHLAKNANKRKVALYQINQETLDKEVILVSSKQMRKGTYPLTSLREVKKQREKVY